MVTSKTPMEHENQINGTNINPFLLPTDSSFEWGCLTMVVIELLVDIEATNLIKLLNLMILF
jgi:hypothetical protein